jgi:hypothetical protein
MWVGMVTEIGKLVNWLLKRGEAGKYRGIKLDVKGVKKGKTQKERHGIHGIAFGS